MAQIGVTKILDGPRNAVFHVAIEGSGIGDETDFVVIDPATSFDPALPAAPAMTVEKLYYDIGAFYAALEFDFLATDIPVWSMSPGQNCFDFSDFGGIKDRSPVMDGLGKLKVSTTNLAAGDKGTFIVWVRKD